MEGVGVGNLKLNFKDCETNRAVRQSPKVRLRDLAGGVEMRTCPILELPYHGEMIVK